jgi:hypothetical protein
MMKKRDFRYIFYGYKIIIIALLIIGFVFGLVWLFLHFHRFSIGFSVVVGFASITGLAWAIGENKYWGNDHDHKRELKKG